ncbi:MAG: endonuclease/exonuclease/phosphatase family protein [Acidimicrobiia bacterium]|nr:endonuclease/exonuclease/phosphatase family protein [Acidimicrobiia bacterium]
MTGPTPGWADRLCATAPFTALGLVRPLLSKAVRERARVEPPVTAPSGSPAVRLVTANALHPNREPEAWARAVLAVEPDMVIAQEVSDELAAAVVAIGGGRLPHAFVPADRGKGGCAVWSRLPLLEPRSILAGYRAVIASVEVGGLPVTVMGVHTMAPTSARKGAQWRESFAIVADEVEAAAPGPVVCAGDWNATLAHLPLVELLARTGLRDAHTEAGREGARTWPSGGGRGFDEGVLGRIVGSLPPLALLDRVLVSEHLAVGAVRELTAPGSDHRAVVADLAVVAG